MKSILKFYFTSYFDFQLVNIQCFILINREMSVCRKGQYNRNAKNLNISELHII